MPEQSAAERVIELIADELLIDDESTITPETKLPSLGDSLDRAELICRVEEEFGVDISDEQAEEFGTVAELVDYIQSANQP